MMLFLRRVNLPVFLILVICGSLLTSECRAMGEVGNSSAIGDLAFSPDGQTLVFREYKADGRRGLGFLDLETGVRRFISAPDGYQFQDPNYTPDGEQIVAAVYETLGQSQIVIMDAYGGNLRELTEGPGCRNDPSFSPNGDRLLFVYSPIPEQKGGRQCQHQDIYELEVASKQVKQLTDFSFYSAMSPQYLADGEHFIFAGDGPKKNASYKIYVEKYGENNIHIMGRGKSELRPAITGYDYSSSPSISVDEKITFIVRTNRIDDVHGKYNFDIFLRISNQDRRLTKLNSYIWSQVISPDGERVAFLMDSSPDSAGVFELMIMNTDGSGLRSLGISGRLD